MAATVRPYSPLTRAVLAGSLITAVGMVALPIYLLVKYAVSDPASINTGGEPVPLWPYAPTLRTFAYLFSDREFYGVLWTSVTVALGTVFLSLLLGVPAAYVLSRNRVPGRFFRTSRR